MTLGLTPLNHTYAADYDCEERMPYGYLKTILEK